jgi:Tfp pilus assembly protein PilO
MNLSKQKQFDLLKLGAVTLAVLLVIWFLLIRPAQARLNEKTKISLDLTKNIQSKKEVIQRAEEINAHVQESGKKLLALEGQMVTGDTYLWIIRTLRDFEVPGKIEFSKYEPPQIVERNTPPKLPYKAASFVVTGTAAYHDLGNFLANFENSYPHIRIQRIDMEPASPGTTSEKLSFLLEMEVLVKSAGTTSGSRPKPSS